MIAYMSGGCWARITSKDHGDMHQQSGIRKSRSKPVGKGKRMAYLLREPTDALLLFSCRQPLSLCARAAKGWVVTPPTQPQSAPKGF